MFKRGINSKRFWRAFIGVVTAYAIATQSLLIVLGGFNLAADANEAQPAFALCLHDGQSAPDLPSGVPGFPRCTHCIFCFAGSHHALIGSPVAVIARIDVDFIDAPWVADKYPLPRLSAYSIASPRGPPPRA